MYEYINTLMHTEIETDTATDIETISYAVNGNKSNGETGQRELNPT